MLENAAAAFAAPVGKIAQKKKGRAEYVRRRSTEAVVVVFF